MVIRCFEVGAHGARVTKFAENEGLPVTKTEGVKERLVKEKALVPLPSSHELTVLFSRKCSQKKE